MSLKVRGTRQLFTAPKGEKGDKGEDGNSFTPKGQAYGHFDSSDDFYLFIITLLNIHHLVTDANHFKVNFINRKLQKDIYDFFTDELNSIYENKNRYIKC